MFSDTWAVGVLWICMLVDTSHHLIVPNNSHLWTLQAREAFLHPGSHLCPIILAYMFMLHFCVLGYVHGWCFVDTYVGWYLIPLYSYDQLSLMNLQARKASLHPGSQLCSIILAYMFTLYFCVFGYVGGWCFVDVCMLVVIWVWCHLFDDIHHKRHFVFHIEVVELG